MFCKLTALSDPSYSDWVYNYRQTIFLLFSNFWKAFRKTFYKAFCKAFAKASAKAVAKPYAQPAATGADTNWMNKINESNRMHESNRMNWHRIEQNIQKYTNYTNIWNKQNSIKYISKNIFSCFLIYACLGAGQLYATLHNLTGYCWSSVQETPAWRPPPQGWIWQCLQQAFPKACHHRQSSAAHGETGWAVAKQTLFARGERSQFPGPSVVCSATWSISINKK